MLWMGCGCVREVGGNPLGAPGCEVIVPCDVRDARLSIRKSTLRTLSNTTYSFSKPRQTSARIQRKLHSKQVHLLSWMPPRAVNAPAWPATRASKPCW